MSDNNTLVLEPADTDRLANLCGQFDQHLKQIEERLGVELFCRGNVFTVKGEPRLVRAASRLLEDLYEQHWAQLAEEEASHGMDDDTDEASDDQSDAESRGDSGCY